MSRSRRAAAPTTRWRNAVGVFFALGGVLSASWGPRLPTIKGQLGLDDAALGLLVIGSTAAAVVGLACSSTLYSRFGGRIGVPLTTVIAAAGLSVVGVGSALGSPALLEIGFLAFGFGIGITDVLINVEGTAVEAVSNKVVLPVLHACWSAGAVVGSALGAASAALAISPVWQFLGESALIACAALLCARHIPDRTEQVEDSAGNGGLRGWLRTWLSVRLLLIGLIMFGVEVGENSANTWLTLGAAQGHGLPEAVAALFFTAFAISETTFRLLSAPIVRIFGRTTTVRATTALGVLGLALFILGGPAWVVLLGAVLWAVGVSMGFPLGISAAAEGPAPSAPRVSVVSSVGYAAGLTAPPVIGLISQGIGLLNALWVIVAVLIVASVAAGALRSISPQTPKPAERAS